MGVKPGQRDLRRKQVSFETNNVSLFSLKCTYRGEKRDPDADDEGEIKMSVVIIRLSQGMIDHPEEEKKNK